MSRLSVLIAASVVAAVFALSTPSSRRAFLTKPVVAAASAGASSAAGLAFHGISCQCPSCVAVANAYEARPVGGADASPETKAMNLQAIETNNRLEREGLKMETSAEQSASLTSALNEYTYEPSSTSKGKDDKKKGRTSNQSR